MRINSLYLLLIPAFLICNPVSCSSKSSDVMSDSDNFAKSPVCGNGIIEEGEFCDLTQAECKLIKPDAYEDGFAKCKEDCLGYDYSQCVKKTECGNNIVEAGEACDGNAKACSEVNSEKYILGKAPCFKSCTGWDSQKCQTYSECGNDLVEAKEVCERSFIKKCTELNPAIFISGSSTCYNDCSGWNVSHCKVKQCENIECGQVMVVENDYTFKYECGDCNTGEICSKSNKCVLPCENGKCGTVVITDSNGTEQSFNCRKCNDLQYCNTENQCISACHNMACGDDNGVDCGDCPQGYYCSIFPNRCKKLPDIPVAKIPEGAFFMGCNSYLDEYCNESENPYHMVVLDSYNINTYEITVEQYLFCIDSGQCDDDVEKGSHYRTYDINFRCNIGSSREFNQPANCVNYYGAEAFCKFMGGSLPTEAQWEKAARGGCELYENCEEDTYIFPWGNNQATCDHAVIVDTITGIAGCETGGTMPVGSKPDGISPYGLLDVSGNVWEWCSDWFDENYYDYSPEKNPEGPETGVDKILKGGSCNFSWVGVRPSYRYNVAPSINYTFGGFRCVFKDKN